MTGRRRRVFMCVVLLSGLAFGGERLLLGDLTDRRGPAEWVVSHAATLPTTLDEISGYPSNYRRAIVRSLPADIKSRLWREQLQRYLDAASLNSEQRRFVNEAIALLTPGVFEDKGAPERAQLATLCERGEALFAKDERVVFSRIGVVNSARVLSTHGAQGTVLHWLQSIRSARPIRSVRNWYSASASEAFICDCHKGTWCLGDDCPPDADECSDWGCANPGSDDCGCFSLWECNGVCTMRICCD